MLRIDVKTDDKGTKVFRSDKYGFPKYSVALNNKVNDEWKSCFFDCRFKKGVEVQNKTVIKINNAWFSFNEKDGKTYPYIFISDYEVIGGAVPDSGFVNIPEGVDDGLPFN